MPPNPNRRPSLQTVVEEALRQRIAHLHMNLPAKIISYDADTQTATVKPTVKHRLPTSGGSTLIDYPIIPDVPVCHPRWGAWFVHAPLAAGDFVDLIFGEASIDRWRELGGDNVDPVFDHRFDLSDAIAIPMNLYPVAQALVGLSSSHFSIGKLGGAQLHITDDGQFLLGSAAASIAVATAPKTIAQLQAFAPALGDLSTVLQTALAAVAGLMNAAATGSGAPLDTAATVVQASSSTLLASLQALTEPQLGSTIVKVGS